MMFPPRDSSQQMLMRRPRGSSCERPLSIGALQKITSMDVHPEAPHQPAKEKKEVPPIEEARPVC